ncbi:MAG: hypothetical protein K8J31_06050 [Anaerolineae bacterium]|nr:hypothetical protein [Anaerolineae bacterium]
MNRPEWATADAGNSRSGRVGTTPQVHRAGWATSSLLQRIRARPPNDNGHALNEDAAATTSASAHAFMGAARAGH